MSKGTRIKERRKYLGLTLKEVATAVGVTEATAQRWESGNIANFKADKIPKLASVLQIPVEELTSWFKKEAEAEEFDNSASHNVLYSEIELAELFEKKYGKDNLMLFSKFLELNELERNKITNLLSKFSKLDELDRIGALSYIEGIFEKLLSDPKYSAKEGSSNEQAM